MTRKRIRSRKVIDWNYGTDYIEALATADCHIVLEDWTRKHRPSQLIYIIPGGPVQDLGHIGYYGQDGWFMNRASLDKANMRLSYIALRESATIQAMQNSTLPHHRADNCSGFQNFCNSQTGTFTNDKKLLVGNTNGLLVSRTRFRFEVNLRWS